MKVLKWIAMVGASAVVLLLATGFLYEQVGRRSEAKRLPARIGQAVDVGGRTMNLYCSGEGGPAVVFETGGNSPGYTWLLVQPRVAEFTRACWYDRAGVGWSDPPPAPRTSASVARDLHELLHRAGVPGPYVLAGASVGGEYIRVYTAAYPQEVAGLVFVDSSVPDQKEPALMKGMVGRLPAWQREFLCGSVPWLSRFGVMRLMTRFAPFAEPRQFSAQQREVLRSLERRPEATVSNAEQSCAATDGGAMDVNGGTGDPEVDDAARRSGGLGDRPVIVLTAGYHRDAWRNPEVTAFYRTWENELQPSLARLSTRGRQIIVRDSGHGIGFDDPAAVVNAVRDVVGQVRQQSSDRVISPSGHRK